MKIKNEMVQIGDFEPYHKIGENEILHIGRS